MSLDRGKKLRAAITGTQGGKRDRGSSALSEFMPGFITDLFSFNIQRSSFHRLVPEVGEMGRGGGDTRQYTQPRVVKGCRGGGDNYPSASAGPQRPAMRSNPAWSHSV